MELSNGMGKSCDCGSKCSMVTDSSKTWLRSVKRKYDEYEEGSQFFLPGFDYVSTARVQVENECDALREMVSSQQQTIQDLYAELEEERNAAASAANETMSMILKLQREKAEIEMEARQFKRFAEEKLAHDDQEISVLEDLLYKREQTMQSLTCEVQAYKHRLMSYGLREEEVEEFGLNRESSMTYLDGQFDSPTFEYPPLRCKTIQNCDPMEEGGDDAADVEIYPFGEASRGGEHLQHLESVISQMERDVSYHQLDGDFNDAKSATEKIIISYSPMKSRHSRKVSTDSSGSFSQMNKQTGPNFAESPRRCSSFRKSEFVSQTDGNSRTVDGASDAGDDTSDRVYTIDAVHSGVPYSGIAETKPGGASDDFVGSFEEPFSHGDTADTDMKKLYRRLQALEADRESMRQTLLSVSTDKAQLVLLKEIAQHLCKEVSPERQMPLRKKSVHRSFSPVRIFMGILSFVFWRKKARQSKYALGLAAKDAGLLMLLDKYPHVRQWRCLSSTQVR